MNLKKISYQEYHQIANSFIKQVGFHTKTELPLNIELMIEAAGHNIIPINSLYTEYAVKGVVIKKTDGFDIGIDTYHYEENELSFRFTLAEELAHILTHPHIYDQLGTLNEVIAFLANLQDDEYRIMEQQARNVASCLLFPHHLTENYVLDYCKANINQLMAEKFHSKEDLGVYIAEKIYRKLLVSEYIIRRVILNRYPDLIIDSVLDKFGLDLIK